MTKILNAMSRSSFKTALHLIKLKIPTMEMMIKLLKTMMYKIITQNNEHKLTLMKIIIEGMMITAMNALSR